MKPSAKAAGIRHALEHAASGEFSAVIKPADCAVLLKMYDHYFELLKRGAS